MLVQLGLDASCYGVARPYQDICRNFVIHSADPRRAGFIEDLEMKVVITPTVMRTMEEKVVLARDILQMLVAGEATSQGV